MNKDIINKNDKRQWHGYQEWYVNNKLWFRCNYKNDKINGYIEWYGIKQTKFYIR